MSWGPVDREEDRFSSITLARQGNEEKRMCQLWVAGDNTNSGHRLLDCQLELSPALLGSVDDEARWRNNGATLRVVVVVEQRGCCERVATVAQVEAEIEPGATGNGPHVEHHAVGLDLVAAC
jgi:hypothetical protein